MLESPVPTKFLVEFTLCCKDGMDAVLARLVLMLVPVLSDTKGKSCDRLQPETELWVVGIATFT